MPTTRTLKIFIVCTLAAQSFAFAAQSNDLPRDYIFSSPPMQSRVCSEILIALAVSGAKGLHDKNAHEIPNRLDITKGLGATGALHAIKTDSMSEEDKDQAKVQARSIELGPNDQYAAVVKSCMDQSNELISQHEISPQEAALVVEVVERLLQANDTLTSEE